MDEAKRVTIKVSYDLDEWFNVKAKSMGMNKSALMTSVLNQYFEKGLDMEKRVDLAIKRAIEKN